MLKSSQKPANKLNLPSQSSNMKSGFKKRKRSTLITLVYFFSIGCVVGLFILVVCYLFFFEKNYTNKVYPGITVDNIDFGGREKKEVEDYFLHKNLRFSRYSLLFVSREPLATISASKLQLGYDGKLVAEQTYLLGRSGNVLSDLSIKILAATSGINLHAALSLNDLAVDETLNKLAEKIDYPPQDALFKFQSGRVVAFKTASNGKKLNKETTKNKLMQIIKQLALSDSAIPYITVNLDVETMKPQINVSDSNNFGINELIGKGSSTFFHSIENRIYNISLAASRLNGILIPPGAIFSFNDALGDVSGLTGYKSAYIIKEGKTILGDGGGICQVSTTLFRAALNSGLPVIERWAHSYRVGYYEQDEPPGIDATVFAPTNDLKIKNDTNSYILVQSDFDEASAKLSFLLYGQKDGRSVFLTKPKLWDYTQAPPDIYQDDPSLAKGVVKQIDFAAPGSKTSFEYRVERQGKIIFQQIFFSNYRPWQAVFLRGTKE